MGLHHGPSLRRRRGGGEKKNKNPAMELSPPPLGISEAAAAPPAVRSLQLQFPARMLRLPPLPPVPRCAVPRGAGPARRPGGAQKRGWGDAQQVPLVGSRSEMQKRSLLPLGERAAATKWCLSGPELQWRDGRGRIQAGPARVRVLVPREGGSRWRGLGSRRGAGQVAVAGASALTLTPTRAHSQLLLLLPLLLQEAGGGWCIKGEAPPNRVSSPRTLPQQRWWPRQRLRLLSAAVERTQPRSGTWAAGSELADPREKHRCTLPTSHLLSHAAKGGVYSSTHKPLARCLFPDTCASGQQREVGSLGQAGSLHPGLFCSPLYDACSPLMKLKGKAWGCKPQKERRE